MIRLGDTEVHLDTLVRTKNNIAILSIYDGSLQRIKSFCAMINLKEANLLLEKEVICNTDQFSTYITPISEDKQKFYHAVLLNKNIKETILVTTKQTAGKDFFNFLMWHFDMPLLEWWGSHLLEKAIADNVINPPFTQVSFGKNSYAKEITVDKNIPLEDLEILEVGNYNEEVLKQSIGALFECGKLWISKNLQNRLNITNMNDYFGQYGHALVAALEKHIHPLTQLNGNCNSLALRSMRLYPQQVAMVNGVLQLLKNSRYAILNEGMGVGKTIQAASICEGFFVEKYLKSHKGQSLKDVYSNRERIKYRNIVMAPGHTVEKWANEITKQVPYAKAHILQEIDQLYVIKKGGKKRTCREVWVVSKDFAKLSYMSRPTPSLVKKNKPIRIKTCSACRKNYTTPDHYCPYCDNDEFYFGEELGKADGLICPECNEILLEYRTYAEGSGFKVLNPEDFSNPTNGNSKCFYCGAVLWQPHTANVDMVSLWPSEKHIPWYRATHYSNKTHVAKKSVWVHKRYSQDYFDKAGEKPLNEKPDCYGVRKYSPAAYIKKYMKGFWDFAVFDEAHQYKGGGTGQGNAMGALVKSSKKQLALTGTIAGGVAQDLFYLLYRLDPQRMIDKGYKWSDVMKFNEKYGTLETEYEIAVNEDGLAYNQMTRGKQLRNPVVKPGISPLVFTDFLLDKAVFLDLSDMSKYLPSLKEYVVTVIQGPEESEMKKSYYRVIEAIKCQLREKGGKKLMGKLLQFSLSYLDKPFTEEYIKHPLDGSVICKIDQYPEFWAGDNLLAKEKKLIEILRKELDEGRNCFVYAEYTSSPNTCVSYRLKSIVEKHIGVDVVVLESTSPEPLKREAWIHEQAEKGVRVVISNPRCVETGLDFCWEKDGIYYNFPTIIFYQMGYSLFTIWQASRRHYRLIQREECRTYYMALANTIQSTVIQLIAEKQVATSAIQGKFSTEGLAAMAQGVDMKVKLAQALAEQDFNRGNDLQEMFDILAQSEQKEDTTYDEYEPMKTVCEIIGDELYQNLSKSVEDVIDIDALLYELMGDMDDEREMRMKRETEPRAVRQVVKLDDIDSLFAVFD